MTHSYKKTPVFKDGSIRPKTRKYSKKVANKMLRKIAIGGNGERGLYKRVGLDPWEICDYRFYEAKELNFSKEDKNHWEKYYRRK